MTAHRPSLAGAPGHWRPGGGCALRTLFSSYNRQRRPPATLLARRISVRQVSLRAQKVTLFANN